MRWARWKRSSADVGRTNCARLIEPLESRVLLSVATDLTIGVGGYKSITYHAAGGASATIALTGGGSATVHFLGDSITQSVKNNAVTLKGSNITCSGLDATGTTSNSVLKVTTKAGTVSIGTISTDGSFKSIQGTGVALTSSVIIEGDIAQISVQRITGGTFLFGTATNAVIKVATNATFNIAAKAVKSITVGGSLTGSEFVFSNSTQGSATNLGTLSVKGAITGLKIISGGNLGNISASKLMNSTIFSGVGILGAGQSLPASTTDFVADNRINSLKLKKVAGVVSFSNDNVSAHDLGTLTLGGVLLSNGGTAFGLAATSFGSVNFVAGASGKTIQLKNVTSQSQVTSAVSKAGANLHDFQVNIVS
jgi:hypothetical protein